MSAFAKCINAFGKYIEDMAAVAEAYRKLGDINKYLSKVTFHYCGFLASLDLLFVGIILYIVLWAIGSEFNFGGFVGICVYSMISHMARSVKNFRNATNKD